MVQPLRGLAQTVHGLVSSMPFAMAVLFTNVTPCVGTSVNQYPSTQMTDKIKLNYFKYLNTIYTSSLQHQG